MYFHGGWLVLLNLREGSVKSGNYLFHINIQDSAALDLTNSGIHFIGSIKYRTRRTRSRTESTKGFITVEKGRALIINGGNNFDFRISLKVLCVLY